MPRPCHQSHSPSPATCRLCWLAANDPRYAKLWQELSANLPSSQSSAGKPRLTVNDIAKRRRH